MKKTIATMLAAGLVAGAFLAVPAEAKKKKKKKPAACAAYVPGEKGAEAETLVVTDAATAEAPATFDFSLPEYFLEGIDGGQPSVPLNVQVDSAASTAGLYVTWEFQSHRDYDLWAYRADGSEAASSHGFQPLIDTKGAPGPADQSNTASNHAGESTADTENIVGLITPDCGGYTLEMLNYLGEGGDFQLKVWLGEGKTEPKAAEG
ncbi:MAG: hypothetical protein ACLGHL_00355 [Actinomycetota bacterium]